MELPLSTPMMFCVRGIVVCLVIIGVLGAIYFVLEVKTILAERQVKKLTRKHEELEEELDSYLNRVKEE